MTESVLESLLSIHVVTEVYGADDFFSCKTVFRCCSVKYPSLFTKRCDTDNHKGEDKVLDSSFSLFS